MMLADDTRTSWLHGSHRITASARYFENAKVVSNLAGPISEHMQNI